ncbi:MAG TPA: hypothetical protein VIG24_00710, partial [Acidimicrobiia bacterium]
MGEKNLQLSCSVRPGREGAQELIEPASRVIGRVHIQNTQIVRDQQKQHPHRQRERLLLTHPLLNEDVPEMCDQPDM